MKKLLGILVLGLLWCSFSAAGEMNLWNKTVKLPDDVSKGYKKHENLFKYFESNLISTSFIPEFSQYFKKVSDE